MANVSFKEKQKFDQWWVWAFMLLMPLIPAYGIYKQVFLGTPWGSKPMSDIALYLFLAFTLLVIGMLCLITLTTEIDDERIKMKLFPFASKDIAWSDVQSAEVVDYGFVGGWGVRVGTKHGTVYNTSGSMGLAIVLNDGTKLCIGTQKEEELRRFIRRLR